jgi:signal peptidase I
MRQCEDATVDSVAALKCSLAGEALRSFGSLRFPAIGWSMLPVIWPGDTLVVERVSQDRVRIGDVVVVGRHGKLCAHRVVSIEEDRENPQWITQGDALPAPDCPVAANELLGRVAYLIRAGKCVAVPAELSGVEQLIAKIVRRSTPAARALVYLHRMGHTPGKSAAEKSAAEKSSSEKSVLPCQG